MAGLLVFDSLISSLCFVELLDLFDCVTELGHSLGGCNLVHRLRHAAHVNLVSLVFGGLALTDGTSEEVLVLLSWEVYIIETMSMRVFCWVVPVVLPERVSAHVLGSTVGPVL